MSAIIEVENLGKKYILRHEKQAGYTTLRDVITNKAKIWGRKLISPCQQDHHQSAQEEFWALKDVSFEIQRGDRVGIIGRNGAGKSTLLKILSRITEPTTGRVKIRGRVASLLEVGTGFHPELTGRENIYLNGAILGMSRNEIARKFDEIVNFAEVEKFLDLPVKRYSSGMYVRLAFAVAAHLEPEILVIDEVLAVGDIAFQKKCLGKMEEVGKDGRTVLFVSHNMAMITALCSKAILLDNGRINSCGSSVEIAQQYFSQDGMSRADVDYSVIGQYPGDEVAQLRRARILNANLDVTAECKIDEPIVVEMEYVITKPGARVCPNFHFFTADGTYAFVSSDTSVDLGEKNSASGKYKAICTIPPNLLNSGTYYVGFALSTLATSTVHFYEKNLLSFTVVEEIYNSTTRGEYVGSMPGVVRPLLKWECERLT